MDEAVKDTQVVHAVNSTTCPAEIDNGSQIASSVRTPPKRRRQTPCSLPASCLAATRVRPVRIDPALLRALYRRDQPLLSFDGGNGTVVHVFGQHVDHRRGHAVRLGHIVPETENHTVLGNGVTQILRRVTLPVGKTVSRQIDIRTCRNRARDLRVHLLRRRLHDDLGKQFLPGVEIGPLRLPEDKTTGVEVEESGPASWGAGPLLKSAAVAPALNKLPCA